VRCLDVLFLQNVKSFLRLSRLQEALDIQLDGNQPKRVNSYRCTYFSEKLANCVTLVLSFSDTLRASANSLLALALAAVR